MADSAKRARRLPDVTRRGFLKGGLAATAVIAASGSLVACSGNNQPKEVVPPEKSEPDAPETEAAAATVTRDLNTGTWVTAACWHNCGGRCLNKVLVRDGVVVRQKTDDTHADSPDFPQQRACVRGRSQRNHVFSEDRLKYPMKRVSWQPGGGENSHGELRGVDEWERITWDEAYDYIANEIQRIVSENDNRSLFADGGAVSKFLSLYGGYIGHWGTTSRGAWTYTPDVVGIAPQPNEGINDRIDMRNSDIVIMVGTNPAWSSAGNPAYHLLQIKKAGAKFVAVDPFYNDSYALVDAEWIPCRPSTDTTLFLGMAYAMLEMDEEKGLIDWDYLNTHTIGFDADHMPEGEDPAGNFKDYLLGTNDGTPKTPEWASRICGVEPDKIRYLAELAGKDNKTAILMAWASARTHNADTLPQLVMTLGAMGGHFGKSGHMCGLSCHSRAMSGGTYLVGAGSAGLPSIKNPLGSTEGINDTEMWNAIVDGKYTYAGGSTNKVPGEPREVDIKLIYHDSMNAKLQTTDGQAKGIEAHRKVDLVVTHSLFMTTNAMYSDFVLPIESYWEKEGGFLQGNREALIYHSKVVEPMYECKSDEEIASQIGTRLGLDPAEVFPFDAKQQLFNQFVGAYVIDEAGEKKPLVSITDKNIADWGCEGEPQEGAIATDELIETGLYQIPRKEGDAYGYIAYEAFVKDPEANPMKTESGKQEIYSRVLRDTINAIGYSTIEAIPTYVPPQEGFEATFSDFEAGVKGDYPFQVYNPHYLRRSHTVFDNVEWLRETWPNPVFLNANDAKKLGIAEGDTVLLTSPHGKCIRQACPTNRFMEGVIGLPHGAWVDIDPETGIDRAGSDNILTGQIQSGQGVSGWNTCICNIEKYNETLAADYEVPMRIPAAQTA